MCDRKSAPRFVLPLAGFRLRKLASAARNSGAARSLFFAAALCAACVLSSCSSSTASSTSTSSGSAGPGIEHGGDISEIPIEVQSGTVYHDANGNAVDPMALAQQHGWTVARIRLFVNPPMTGVEVNTLSYAVVQGVSAKQHGMKILLDIHYSDNWDSGTYHDTPAAWQGQSYSELLTTVQSYTTTVMQTFQEAGALPDYVQIGNEVGDGLFWPTGGPIYFNSNGTVQNPALYTQFIGLVKAGIAGVKAVSSTTKIVIHIPGGAWASWCTEFFDLFNAQGVNYDIIGLSYYPNLNGSTVTDLSDITATLNEMHNRYGKQLWIVEFSYGWNWGISSGVVYPNTPTGQYDVTQALIDLVTSYSDGGGVVYWGGFYVDNASLGSDSWEGQALFDYPNHNMLPAFGAL
jgi:arabinogalactan endo-1,4-beta-galactosidase